MFRRRAYWAIVPLLAVVLGGCAMSLFHTFQPRAPWRDAEEQACMGDPASLASVDYTRLPRIKGQGPCGIYAPVKVSAFVESTTAIVPNPTIGCPLAAMLNAWVNEAVQPAALAWFGEPVVELDQFDAYSCRTVDSIPGENLSEHAYGNAIDIAAYKLADGRKITVKGDFLRGKPDARGFLHEIFAAACLRFKTVLGPGYPEHDDHFHLDLAHQNADGTLRYCNPKPDVIVPPRPPYAGPQVATAPAEPLFNVPAGYDPRPTGSIAKATR